MSRQKQIQPTRYNSSQAAKLADRAERRYQNARKEYLKKVDKNEARTLNEQRVLWRRAQLTADFRSNAAAAKTVLQYRSIRRNGGTQEVKIDVKRDIFHLVLQYVGKDIAFNRLEDIVG
jgi:hypothetical protein